jgi:hypothetical protein
MNSSPNEPTGLAYYIREILYKRWAKDRQPLEEKWQRNLNAFKAVSEGQWKKEEAEGWRSDTFIQMTKIKILAAWSLVTDMFLQGGKFPFSLQLSPYSDMQLEGMPEDMKANVEQAIEDQISLIHQELQDCQGDQHLMKCVMSSAIYGETYGKKFVQPVQKSYYNQTDLSDGMGLPEFQRFEKVTIEKNQPAWRYASVWDIFRDIEEDDLKISTGVIERQWKSPYQLRQCKGQDLYLGDAIDSAIKAAPEPGTQSHTGQDTSAMAPGLRDIKHRSKTIEVLEFWGRVPRKIVEEFESNYKKQLKDTQKGVDKGVRDNPISGLESISQYEHDGDEVEVMVMVAGNDVVRFARTDPEDRPYYRAVWETSLDENHGCGVADNMEQVQKVLNGMVRAFEDNKKLSANVILGVKKRFMAKQDGVFQPGKEIEIAEECDDVRQAIQQVTIQDVGETILSGIALFERYADESSQLPKIMQGETAEKKKPDTLGELNMLQQNAGKYIGGVIKNHDEGLIEPIITDFYQYNMDNPDEPQGKGNFVVRALGFSSFQNRVTRLEKIMTFLNLLLGDEELRTIGKVKDLLREVAKALDLDPDDVVKTDQEQQQDAQQKAEQIAMMEQAEQDREEEIARRQLEVGHMKHQQDLEKEETKFQNDVILTGLKGGRST